MPSPSPISSKAPFCLVGQYYLIHNECCYIFCHSTAAPRPAQLHFAYIDAYVLGSLAEEHGPSANLHIE